MCLVKTFLIYFLKKCCGLMVNSYIAPPNLLSTKVQKYESKQNYDN